MTTLPCGSTLTQLYHWSGFGAMDFAVQTWSPWSPATVSDSFLLEQISFAAQFRMCVSDEALPHLAAAVSMAEQQHLLRSDTKCCVQ